MGSSFAHPPFCGFFRDIVDDHHLDLLPRARAALYPVLVVIYIESPRTINIGNKESNTLRGKQASMIPQFRVWDADEAAMALTLNVVDHGFYSYHTQLMSKTRRTRNIVHNNENADAIKV